MDFNSLCLPVRGTESEVYSAWNNSVYIGGHVVGVSLNKLHTSVAALQDACVCMYVPRSVCVWPYTEILVYTRTCISNLHVC